MAYNPSVAYRGDAYLAQGLTSLGTALGEALTKKKEDERNRAREFNALATLAETRGWASKDQATAMDLDSLRGLVQGKADAERDQYRQTQQAVLMQQLAGLQGQQAGTAALMQAFRQAGSAAPAMIAAPGAPTSEQPLGARLMQALGQNPLALQAPGLPGLLNTLAGLAPDAQNQVREGKTASGTPYITYGNTFQFDPTATAQTRADAQKDLIEFRNNLPANQRDQFDALNAEKRALIAAKGRALLPELAQPYDAAIAAIDARLAQLVGGQTPAPVAAGTNAAPAIGYDDFLNWKQKR